MSTPAQVVEQGLQDGFQRAQQRKQELEDEKRRVTLKTLQEDAETPQDKVAAIDAVYHKDPGVLKQHVENLTRKLTGQETQPVVPPAQAQQSRLAPLVARGKTPDQQALTQQAASGEIANKQNLSFEQQQAAQKQQQVFALIDKYVTDPDQNKALKEDFVRKQAGVNAGLKTIPGQAGLPVENPAGSGQYFQPVQTGDGSIGYRAMPPGWRPPAPKPPAATPKVGVSHGKNVYGILTPQGWVDAGTKQPLNDFRPLPTYAQLAPSLRAVQVVSPNDENSTEYMSIPEAIKTHAKGPQSNDYKIGMPTGQMRGRAQLAGSANEQIDDLTGLLKSRSDIFGPAAGRETRIAQWLGTQDPDAQRAQAALTIVADHLQGTYGSRSATASKQIHDAVGLFKTNPEASIAALNQFEKASKNIEKSGGAPAPKKDTGAQHKMGEVKKFPNGKTGKWDGQGWVAQ